MAETPCSMVIGGYSVDNLTDIIGALKVENTKLWGVVGVARAVCDDAFKSGTVDPGRLYAALAKLDSKL